jgi:hypothetical protein
VCLQEESQPPHLIGDMMACARRQGVLQAMAAVEMRAQDWLNVGAGLGAGMAAIFGLIALVSPPAENSIIARRPCRSEVGRGQGKPKAPVMTPTNFWLVMSGVIHVSPKPRPACFESRRGSTDAFPARGKAWIEGSFVFVRDTSFIKPGVSTRHIMATTGPCIDAAALTDWAPILSHPMRKLDYYASGDLRYGSPMEPGTAAMEAITAVMEGPLCWLIAYGHTQKAAWRHPAQLVLCTCQVNPTAR